MGEICDRFGGEVQTGPFGSQLHSSDYSLDGIPVVMPQDMHDGRVTTARIARVDGTHAKRLRQHALRRGDIAFSRRGDVARFAVITETEEGWLCGTGSIRIRLNCPDIDTGYLRRYLSQPSIGAWLEHNAKGVTMPNLNTTIVRALPLAYPPLLEQRRVAAILDQADALRAKRREALAQLDSLTQSIFIEMFGDFVANPRGFSVSLLGKLCDVRDGTHDSPKYVTDGYPLVTSKNLSGGYVDLTDVNLISERDYDAINKRSKVDRGDLLMPMIGTIGNPVLIEHEPAYAVKNVAIVKFPKGSPSNIFIRAVLSGAYFDHVVSQKNRGGTQKFLSLGDLRSIPVPLPQPSLQHTFATRIQAVESLKAIQRAALAESDALFASLQHRAFAGQLS